MTPTAKIVALCEQRGISRASVEHGARLPAGRISKWTAGAGEPTARQILRIARYLDVPLEWLCDDQCGMPPTSPEAGLTDDDRQILRLARLIGHDLALLRLASVDQPRIETRRDIDRDRNRRAE